MPISAWPFLFWAPLIGAEDLRMRFVTRVAALIVFFGYLKAVAESVTRSYVFSAVRVNPESGVFALRLRKDECLDNCRTEPENSTNLTDKLLV